MELILFYILWKFVKAILSGWFKNDYHRDR